MKINGDVQIAGVQQNLAGTQYQDTDINLFDYDNNGVVEGYEYDDFIRTTQTGEAAAQAEGNMSDMSEAQKAAEKLTQELFGDINIPSSVNEYTGITSISKAELNEKLGTDYNKSYASQATIEFTKRMHGTDDVKYVDGSGTEHTIKSKEDIKKYKQSVPENPQDIPIGSIVTMDDPKGGNFHSGLLIGYTKDGKALVMEANSSKANGGAAIVAYDFNSSSAKSIKGYIPVEGLKDEKPDTNNSVAENQEYIPQETEAVQDDTALEEPEAEVPENFENGVLHTEADDTELSDSEKLTQGFVDKVFGEGINLKDFPADGVTNDKKGHYIKAGSTTKEQFEAGMGINYGSKYASQAAIDMAKLMYGLGADDTLKDAEGHNISSKEDIQKYGKDIPATAEGEYPVPIGSMVIADDPKGGNFHAGILVGYTSDGRAIVSEANSAKSADGQGAALAVYSFNSNDEKSIKKYIPMPSEQEKAETPDVQATEDDSAEQIPVENVQGVDASTVPNGVNNGSTEEDTSSEYLEKVLNNAYKYLGMTEKEVEELTGRSFCNGFYCADFVHSVLLDSIGEENLPEWYQNCKGKSSCSNVLAAAEQAGCAFTDPSEIQEGHVYLVIFNTKRGSARHMGFLNSADNKYIYTIEGNSTKGKVCERTYEQTNTKRINSYILLA